MTVFATVLDCLNKFIIGTEESSRKCIKAFKVAVGQNSIHVLRLKKKEKKYTFS